MIQLPRLFIIIFKISFGFYIFLFSNLYENNNYMGSGFPPTSGQIPPTSGSSGWLN